jgi:dihydrofolate reductase
MRRGRPGSPTTVALVVWGSLRDRQEEETSMPRLLVRNLSISLDGYAAGPHQDLDHPLGIGGTQLHEWIFATRSGRRMIGREGGTEGIDDDYFSERGSGVGATIMGRNMFGPIRGPWGESEWTGWWGEEPPFHHPVFVLTHHPRAPLEMQGGTTFYFVDRGIDAALGAALEAAGGHDVLVGGGAATIRQYLRESLIDEMHLVGVPVLLGRGERLFDDLGPNAGSYRCVERVCSPAVTHFRIARTGRDVGDGLPR